MRQIFEELERAKNDFAMTWRGMLAALQAAQETTAAVAARIKADRDRDTSRLEELEQIMGDSTRSAVARKVSELEALELKSRAYAPTAGESALIQKHLDDARAALADAGKLRENLTTAFGAASEALKAARAETIGNGQMDPVLASRWIDGADKNFRELGR